VAALVQRPLAAIITQPDTRRPRELEGRTVGVSGLRSDPAVLRAVVEGDGGDYEEVRQVTIGFAAVPNLIQKKIDAVPAFWNAEGVILRQRGVRSGTLNGRLPAAGGSIFVTGRRPAPGGRRDRAATLLCPPPGELVDTEGRGCVPLAALRPSLPFS
jgi:ABC-type nitrate/sulfonate/bicarbonate transport system substrate-binding protein